jgi:intracellular septation protein
MIQSLFEYLPLVLFFGLTHFFSIKIATIALVASSLLQVIVYRIAGWKFNTLQLWGLGAVLILGPASLALNNPMILKIKPTVIFTLFPLCGVIALKWKNINWVERLFMELMKGQDMTLPDSNHPFWISALWKFSFFFFFLSAVNLGVAFYATDEQWAAFKLFGIAIMTTIFIGYLGYSAIRTAESLATQHDL